MSEQTYLLSFTGVSVAEANRYAEELRDDLLDSSAGVVVQRQRENPLAQDFGASLVLLTIRAIYLSAAYRFSSVSLSCFIASR